MSIYQPQPVFSYGTTSGPAISGIGMSNFAAPVNGYYGSAIGGFVPYSNYAYRYGGPVVASSEIVAAVPTGFHLDNATLAEIESRVLSSNPPRQAVVRRQIIKVPGPPGKVQQIVRRLPTPQPDMIEKVYVVKPQRDVVNVLIERPTTPPPQIQERRVVGKTHRPIINQKVVRVAPRLQYNIASYGVSASQPISVSYGGYQPFTSVIASNDSLGAFGGYTYPSAPAFSGLAAYQPAAGYTGATYQPQMYPGYQPQQFSSVVGYQPAAGYTGAAYQPQVYPGYQPQVYPGYQPQQFSSVVGYQPAAGYTGAAYQSQVYPGYQPQMYPGYQPQQFSSVVGYQPAAGYTGAAYQPQTYPGYQAATTAYGGYSNYGINPYYQYYPYSYPYFNPYGYTAPSAVYGYTVPTN